MTDIVATVRAHLLTVVEITNIVGNRIWSDVIRQSLQGQIDLPALVVREIASNHDHYLSGARPSGHWLIWVDAITGRDLSQRQQLGDSVRLNLFGLGPVDVAGQWVEGVEYVGSEKRHLPNYGGRDIDAYRYRNQFWVHAPETVLHGG